MRRAGLLLGVAVAACGADLGSTADWRPWDTIEGPRRPELVQPPAPAPPQARIRLVTYNTRLGVDVASLGPYLQADPILADADVVLLQETDGTFDAVPSDAARLAESLAMGHAYAPTIELEEGTRGIAILSRFELRDVEVMFLPVLEETLLPESSRAALGVVIDTPSGPLRIINVHLDVGLNVAERIVQLRPAVVDAPTPVVVAGDMNTNDYVWAEGTIPLLPVDAAADTSQAAEVDDFMRALGYAAPTATFGATYDGLLEDYRLDAIYPRGVAARDGGVDRALELSDHWPIWLDLEVAP